MMCANPLDVEGRRRKNKKAAQQQQQQTTFEVTACHSGGESHKVTKGQRPKLRLKMPPAAAVKAEVKVELSEDSMEGLTPILEETLG